MKSAIVVPIITFESQLETPERYRRLRDAAAQLVEHGSIDSKRKNIMLTKL